jgi:hypothetical protein
VKIDFSTLKEVTSPNLYLDKALTQADPNGIISEVIFGPTKSYTCQCKQLNSRSLHENKICPNCGVLCTTNEVRYTNFAKIKLLFPIVKKHSNALLLKILKKKYKHIIDPIQADLSSSSITYLKYDGCKDEIELVNTYDTECLPIAVTGLFTLYINLYFLANYYHSNTAIEVITNCYSNELLVTPPGTRLSLIADDNGNKKIFKNELDETYINVLSIQKYNKEQYGDTVDVDVFYKMSQISIENNINTPIIDEQLKLFDGISSYYQYHANKAFDYVSEKLSGKTGLIRRSFLGKTIDFSSRAVITVDPNLLAYQIKIPRTSFIRLYQLEYLRFLKEEINFPLPKILNMIKKNESEQDDCYEYFEEFTEYFFTRMELKQKLVIINRVPSLWRFNIPICEITGINSNDTITISPMIVTQQNADFDGDTESCIRIHSKEGQQEALDIAFQRDSITYDHNKQYLATIKNEAVYAFNLLALTEPKTEPLLSIDHLSDLPFDYDLILDLNSTVLLRDQKYSYGLCLLNKWLYLDDILITSKNDDQDISHIIFINSKSNEEYHTKLIDFNKKLNWLIATHRTQTLSFELDESCEVLDKCSKNDLLKNLPRNPYIGYYIHNALIDNVINELPNEYNLTKLLKAKFKKKQFSRSVIGIGYVADDKNFVYQEPINATLLGGLNEEDFFKCSIGTRKGITDKHELTPKSGHLSRSVIMNLSPLEIAEYDCGTNHGYRIKILNKQHAKMLVNRYFKNSDGQWEKSTLDRLIPFIGGAIVFRSPITCQTDNFKICQKCFGEYEIADRKYVGIHSGVIAERLTQLSMRS